MIAQRVLQSHGDIVGVVAALELENFGQMMCQCARLGPLQAGDELGGSGTELLEGRQQHLQLSAPAVGGMGDAMLGFAPHFAGTRWVELVLGQQLDIGGVNGESGRPFKSGRPDQKIAK